jgi:Putative virion core protein (lumpy skin disease virus)
MSDLLSGIVKGISGFLPQDDPDIKIFNAQNKLKELSSKEDAVFARFGRRLFETQGTKGYPEINVELEQIKADRKTAEDNLQAAKNEKTVREQAKAEEMARTCSSCGSNCPEGTNFCPECGTKIISPPAGRRFCSNCGTEIPPGGIFCGSCGTRTE